MEDILLLRISKPTSKIKACSVLILDSGLSQITTYKLPLSSSTQILQSFKYTMNGKGPIPSRQDAPHPHQVTTDPTGQYLLVPDLGADQIRIYSINSATGMLTACPSYIEVGGTGPRHGTFWNNNILYVANELANTVHEFSVSYPTGGCLTLTRLQVLTTLPNNKTAPTGTKVAEVHTFDNFLYAATRRDLSFAPNDSIAAYSVANTTGTMTFMNITSSGGTYPRTFSINKAGDMVAIGDQTTANVVVVARNVATGALGPQIASLRIGSVGTPENDDGLSDVKWDE
jgi:6-phosphogluconolactonase (cycloisomerase 2 family)